MIVRELITKLGFKVDEQGLKRADSRFKSFKEKSLRALKIGAFGVTTALLGIGTAAIKTASDMETLTTQFEVMLGSADAANEMINNLREFSVKTPFELEDLAKASTTLLQFGVNANDIMPTVRMLGDVAGSNRERFSSLALVFGQIQSTGRLMGQDLLQLINQGFNPLQIISQKTGKSVAVLKEEMAKGQISAEQVTEAFKIATSEGGLFFQNMQKQSLTLTGLLSTMRGAFKDVLITIGNSLLPVIKTFTDTMINLAKGPIQELAQGFTAVLLPIFEKLGDILPILTKALLPILTLTGDLLGRILVAIMPVFDLLEPIIELISELMPIITMIIELVEPFIPLIVKQLIFVIKYVTFIIRLIRKLFMFIKPFILAPLKWILGIIGKIQDKVQGIFENIFGVVEKVMDKVIAFFTDSWNWIATKINQSIDAFNNIAPNFMDIKGRLPMLEGSMQNQAAGKTNNVNSQMNNKIDVNVSGGGDPNAIGRAVGQAVQKTFSIELKKVLVSAIG